MTVNKMTNGGLSIYKHCPTETLGITELLWSNHILYQSWFICTYANALHDIGANLARKCTRRAFPIVAVKASVSSTVGL